MRDWVIPLLTGINSVTVATTYFQSCNDFRWHNELDEHQLTSYSSGLQPILLGLSVGLCGFVLLSNQIGMSASIAKFMNRMFGTRFRIEEKAELSWPAFLTTGFGSACKAVISSSSFLSWIRDFIKNWGFAFFGFCCVLLGNFGATLVVLLEHTQFRFRWSNDKADKAAKFIGFTYGLSQGALYANAIFNPLVLTGAIAKRPGPYSDAIGQGIFWVNLIPLIDFAVVSGLVMHDKARKVLRRRGEAPEEDGKITCSQKVCRGVASGYRTSSLCSAIFGFAYVLSGENLLLAILVTCFCLLAAPGVFAVLYPTAPEEKELPWYSSYVLLPPPPEGGDGIYVQYQPQLQNGKSLSIN